MDKPGDDVFYNTFISERIKEEKYSEGIYFKIEKVRGNNYKENFDAKRIFEDGSSNAGWNRFFADSKSEHNGAGAKRYGDSFSTFTESIENQQSQNSSQDNNVVPKKRNEKKIWLQQHKGQSKKFVNQRFIQTL